MFPPAGEKSHHPFRRWPAGRCEDGQATCVFTGHATHPPSCPRFSPLPASSPHSRFLGAACSEVTQGLSVVLTARYLSIFLSVFTAVHRGRFQSRFSLSLPFDVCASLFTFSLSGDPAPLVPQVPVSAPPGGNRARLLVPVPSASHLSPPRLLYRRPGSGLCHFPPG